MVKTTPPGAGSRLLRLADDNPVFAYFERRIGGVRLMATGPFQASGLGTACYHSKVGAVELLLNHLLDGKGEYVVVGNKVEGPEDLAFLRDEVGAGLLTWVARSPFVRAAE